MLSSFGFLWYVPGFSSGPFRHCRGGILSGGWNDFFQCGCVATNTSGNSLLPTRTSEVGKSVKRRTTGSSVDVGARLASGRTRHDAVHARGDAASAGRLGRGFDYRLYRDAGRDRPGDRGCPLFRAASRAARYRSFRSLKLFARSARRPSPSDQPHDSRHQAIVPSFHCLRSLYIAA